MLNTEHLLFPALHTNFVLFVLFYHFQQKTTYWLGNILRNLFFLHLFKDTCFSINFNQVDYKKQQQQSSMSADKVACSI